MNAQQSKWYPHVGGQQQFCFIIEVENMIWCIWNDHTHLAVLSHSAHQLCTHFHTQAYCSLHIMHKCSLCLLIDSFTPFVRTHEYTQTTNVLCTQLHQWHCSWFIGYILVTEHRPCFTPCTPCSHSSQLRIEATFLATLPTCKLIPPFYPATTPVLATITTLFAP